MKTFLVYSSTSKILLNTYKLFLKKLLALLKLKFVFISSPTKQKIKTFLKSPHVNKRSKENFELNIHKFKLHLTLPFSLVKIFRCNVPKNIHLKIIGSI